MLQDYLKIPLDGRRGCRRQRKWERSFPSLCARGRCGAEERRLVARGQLFFFVFGGCGFAWVVVFDRAASCDELGYSRVGQLFVAFSHDQLDR